MSPGGIHLLGVMRWHTPGQRFSGTPNTYVAEVLAVGPGRKLPSGGYAPIGVEPGEKVIVYTWSGGSELFTGTEGPVVDGEPTRFITSDDVVCAVDA